LHLRLPRRPVSLLGIVSPREREHGVFANNDLIGDEAIAPFADRMGADAKPRRHDGVAGLTRSRSQASTIFARNVSAAGSERDRVMAKRCVRSSLDIVSVACGRPVSPSIRIPETNAIIMLRTYGTEH
jgi:hypothetical protein